METSQHLSPPPELSSRQRDGEAEWPDLHDLLPSLLDEHAALPDGCDVETYLSMLDGIDASEADKKELIHMLWSIIETIILTQFRLDPISVASRQKGRNPVRSNKDMLYSKPLDNDKSQTGRAAFNGSAKT